MKKRSIMSLKRKISSENIDIGINKKFKTIIIKLENIDFSDEGTIADSESDSELEIKSESESEIKSKFEIEFKINRK